MVGVSLVAAVFGSFLLSTTSPETALARFKNRRRLQMSSPSKTIDAFWRKAEIAVGTGDFASYAALYHPDAVVVEANGTQRVQAALVHWKPGFDATASGRQTTRLSFRFSRRLDNEASAHATGIFRYEMRKLDSNDPTIRYEHFEALMVRKEDRWLWLMENQQGEATSDEWDALPEMFSIS